MRKELSRIFKKNDVNILRQEICNIFTLMEKSFGIGSVPNPKHCHLVISDGAYRECLLNYEGFPWGFDRKTQIHHIDAPLYVSPDSAYMKLIYDDHKEPDKTEFIREIRADFMSSSTPITLVPKIDKVIFNDPATIIFWGDGTKTIVKVQEGDKFDYEKGMAMAIVKKLIGYKEFNKKHDDALHRLLKEKYL